MPKRKYRVRLHTCISEKTWGALIGVGALIRANMVCVYMYSLSNKYEPQRDKTSLRTFGH